MPERIPGFKGEYLWELDVPEHHVCGLAEAIPAERYGWRPAGNARSVSEVIVHIAAGNFGLLDMIGVGPPLDLYGSLEGEGMARFIALVMKNHALEKSLTAKADVLRLLKASLAAVRSAFIQAADTELDRVETFFGEQTSVRRVYLRILAHTHEHMGQLIGYTRMMGLPAPWPDPMDMVRSLAENRG